MESFATVFGVADLPCLDSICCSLFTIDFEVESFGSDGEVDFVGWAGDVAFDAVLFVLVLFAVVSDEVFDVWEDDCFCVVGFACLADEVAVEFLTPFFVAALPSPSLFFPVKNRIEWLVLVN